MKTLGLLLLLLVSLNVKAAIYTVTNTNDSGVGSLRDAVSSSYGGDIVRFDPSLLIGGSDTIVLIQEINIISSITIEGLFNNTDTLFISGNGSSRIFNLGANIQVNFKKLILINGYTNSQYSGAVIYSYTGYSMNVNIDSCIIRNNTAIGSTNRASAIYLNCHASYPFFPINLTITNSEISDNTGGESPIVCYTSPNSSGSSAEIIIEKTTINGNTNSTIAGVLYSVSGTGSKTYIKYSTITNNISSAPALLSLYQASPSTHSVRLKAEILNSSIVSNQQGANIISGQMGTGTYNNYAEIYVKGSILALNTAGATFNSTNTFINQGYNILSATAQDLNLSPLQNNGGFTRTMMPLSPSIAIDAGDASDMSATQNSLMPVGTRDVGAAEYIISCASNSSSFNDSICQGDFYVFNGQNLTSAGTFYDTLINTGGCDSVITLYLTVKSPVTPSVSIAANGSFQVCQGESISFSSSISNGGNSPSYQWKRNGNNVGSGISTYSPNVNSNVNGDVITCVLTSNAFCVSKQKDTSNSITLTINPLPIVAINQNGTDLEATAGYANYEWSYNGNVINNAVSSVYTPTQNGQYSVVVTDLNGCENTDNFSFNTVEVNSLSIENAISIYPNPTSGDIFIKSPVTIKEVSVYDYSGAQKMSYTSVQKISLSELSKGTYIIKLIDDANNQYFKKVVLVN